MAEWLDEDEVDTVLASAKYIDENVEWRRQAGHQTFSVEVLSKEADYDMALVGSVTEQTGYLKLHLFVGPQPITMLHMGKAHHNPNCERLTGKVHKHRWSDAFREKEAYVPDDVDTATWETLLRSFLKECNIEVRGRFAAPQIQRRLL